MRNMKKTLIVVVLALIISAVACSALAAYNGVMYVNKAKINVFKEDNKDSKVIKKLKGGDSVFVDDISPDGKWAQVLIEDTKHGGQKLGFILVKNLSTEYPQSFCKHNWGKWTVEREPTCTKNGYRYRICKTCGLREEQDTKKTGHEWGKWKVTKEATCTKKGERTRTCSVCGKKETEEFLDEHTYGGWELSEQPTCTETGERIRTCKVCGHEQTQELDKLPHDYEYRVTLEATDHSAGVRSKICKDCGKNGGEETFDPDGTLRRGMKGEAVRAMQQLLVDQGYLNVGGADGSFGGGTEKALMQYQQDRGLTPDGVAWPQTLKDLEHDFGPWEVVKPMTRAEAGERMRVCLGCGFEQHEMLESGEVFEKGRRGEDVRALQQIVKELGYDAGGFDGIYGGKLDAAMAGFAADNGLVVEEGKIRPADVDALVNAWLDATPEESWKGEGGLGSPVNLALTVTAGDADESGVTSYNWSVTNMGSEKATFNMLLMTFGDAPDFRQENLVMALDGYDLKPGAGNSISGSFNADANWGEGDMNFAAMAVTEADGSKWLSNIVTFENDDGPVFRTIAPVTNRIDVNNLPDGTYAASFDRGDVLGGASGIFMNAVHIYTRDWYDLADVASLKVGDTIIVEGEEVPVLSLEETEYGIDINRDQDDVRDFYLTTEEDSNGYFVRGMSDLSTYTEQGVTSLVVDADATFTDGWDIEREPETVGYDGIVAAMQNTQMDYFVPQNTTLRVENGRVVEIVRDYVP